MDTRPAFPPGNKQHTKWKGHSAQLQLAARQTKPDAQCDDAVNKAKTSDRSAFDVLK